MCVCVRAAAAYVQAGVHVTGLLKFLKHVPPSLTQTRQPNVATRTLVSVLIHFAHLNELLELGGQLSNLPHSWANF